jgi:hypothetical protein
MKNFTKELKNIITEDPGVPIMSPDELRARSQTIVILTDKAPKELVALAGPERKATLLSINPPMITLPYQKGVFKVRPEDIVFENHHTGRDVTEAGAEETSYEKFFASAMKKFGVSSPIELSPDDTKKFFNYVDKNWEAEEESDVDTNELGPLGAIGLAGLGTAAFGAGASLGLASAGSGYDEDATEDVTTGKVGKKDKGSYQHAYKLALKKYQIHNADELDTPEERKGFTDYVDRLWKKGDIHRDKKEASIDTDITEAPADRDQNDRERKQKQKERERDQAAKEREQDQAAREREQEQKAKEKERDQAGSAEKPAATDDEDDVEKLTQRLDKAKKKKAGGFLSKLRRAVDYDAPSRLRKKEASIPEGVKKTPGVSKKARGAVGFAKHARKGTGAKRQFQKGVRQAGKKQAKNELAPAADASASQKKAGKGVATSIIKTLSKSAVGLDKIEVSPPDRKHQVKGIKKHLGQKGKKGIPKTYVDKKTGKRKETNPWALAWGQYDKYGVPSRIKKD